MSAKVSVSIRNTLRSGGVSLPFEAIAQTILPKGYELSLVLCADTLAQRMNKTYRNKNYFPNVLSFEYDKQSGEIFLNVRKATREATSMGISVQKRTALLFVHGCFHLKGCRHGGTMERLEQNVLRRFGMTQ